VRLTGVPLITPAADSDKPCGNAPETTAQVYGEVPPVALSELKYATFNVAAGSDVVVIVTVVLTVIEKMRLTC